MAIFAHRAKNVTLAVAAQQTALKFHGIDFTRYKFWIEINYGGNITLEGISDANDLAEFLRKKVIYVGSLQEKSLS